jgi:type 1 glutamine amidotransferase
MQSTRSKPLLLMKRSAFLRLVLTGAVAAPAILRSAPAAGARKLVLVAGRPSHPPMMHEHRAGNLLLAKRLRAVPGLTVECYEMGRIPDESTLADADAVVIFADGGGGHPAIQEDRLARLGRQVKRGMGFGCLHFGVEVPRDKGAVEFREWIGGCYEHEWSCNPMWTATYDRFPDHPVCHGVKPFSIHDEWYFNMRFRQGFSADGPSAVGGTRFTPLLVARPSDATRDGPYVYPRGPYAHIQAAKGRNEALMWAVERQDGGRGFGFTGGHFHKNWQDDQFRKVVLNAICWVTQVEVPPEGIVSAPVTDDELKLNLDPK